MATVDPRYTSQTVRIERPEDIADLLQKFAEWPDLVVVNIGDERDAKRMYFCAANLQAVLLARPEVIVAELLPEAVYKELARETVERSATSARGLRATLRSQPLADVAAVLGELLLMVDRVGLLLEGYALQRSRPGLDVAIAELRRVRDALAACCAEQGDHVRCMDALQYELAPALETIRRLF